MPLPASDRVIRVIGFDDAPFAKRPNARVPLCGAVCAGTRFEGMVWGQVRRDGWGATDELCRLLIGGKFLPQLHLVLLDGLAFGGFNVVDLPRLASTLKLPCVAVMRKMPNLDAVEAALQRLSRPQRRMALFRKAGAIHQSPPFVFQVAGATPDEIARALPRLADRGHVPEALRLSHLIGSAVRLGESGRRALPPARSRRGRRSRAETRAGCHRERCSQARGQSRAARLPCQRSLGSPGFIPGLHASHSKQTCPGFRARGQRQKQQTPSSLSDERD